MSIFTPIRLDRLQTALYTTLEDALSSLTPAPEVHWAQTEPTHEQLPANFVALNMIAGPAPFNRTMSQGTSRLPTDSIDITVTSVIVGASYTVKLNGFSYVVIAIGGDTLTTIRDRLVAAVNDDLLEPVTAGDLAADGLTLTADFNGAMLELELFGPLTAAAPVLSDTTVLVHDSEQIMLVNIQAYSKDREPYNGAEQMTAICYAALRSQSIVATLLQNGVGIWTRGSPTSLPIVVGAKWESRSSFDVTFAMRSVWVEDVERIETVVATFDVDGITTEQTITSP